MYYTVGPTLFRTDFNVHLSNGGTYHVLLAVNGTSVRLYVDDIEIGGAQSLMGQIQDCGARSADCLLTIGERPSSSGGAYRLAMLVYDAQLVNGAALTAYPFYVRRPIIV